MTSINQGMLRDLIQSYKRAITKPSVETYELETPNASWLKVSIGLAGVAVAAFLQSIILRGSILDAFNQSITLLDQFDVDTTLLIASRDLFAIAWPWAALIAPFVMFPLGALFLLFMSRLFGGHGRQQDFPRDFSVHAYLLSLSYTPLRIIALTLSIIPLLGSALEFFVYMYQLYCAGVSIQASQGLSQNRALLAVYLPQVALFVLSMVVGLVIGLLITINMLSRVFSQF